MKADGKTHAKRGGAVDRGLVAAFLLSLPIALLIVMTLSPFRDTAKVEPEEEPPRPKLKAPVKAKAKEPPREGTPQKGDTKPQEKK